MHREGSENLPVVPLCLGHQGPSTSPEFKLGPPKSYSFTLERYLKMIAVGK